MVIKIAIIAGTRPELIKLAPLIKLIVKDKEFELILIHSGQHYNNNLLSIFLQELELPNPDYDIQVGSHPDSVQTGNILIKLYDIIKKEKPHLIISEGDTNTVFAAALTAFKNFIPFGHVEAGIRSFDERMPEEINRKLSGVFALFNFAPTNISVKNLINEGIKKERIYKVGNTIVDAVFENLKLANKKSTILKKLNIEKNQKYVVLTAHRPSNVDHKKNLENIFITLKELQDIKIVYPIHPRTKKNMIKFNLWENIKRSENLKIIEPLGYLDMLYLMYNSYFILTDSGGLQEESVILKKPCLTLRYNTERPESVEIGANILVGNDPKKIKYFVKKLWYEQDFYESMIPKLNPYGDGNSSNKIINIIKQKMNKLISFSN